MAAVACAAGVEAGVALVVAAAAERAGCRAAAVILEGARAEHATSGAVVAWEVASTVVAAPVERANSTEEAGSTEPAVVDSMAPDGGSTVVQAEALTELVVSMARRGAVSMGPVTSPVPATCLVRTFRNSPTVVPQVRGPDGTP